MAYMYILECADGTYYTGSTKNLDKRLWQHQNLLGANYTKKKYPVKLVYYEEFERIDYAFNREKQIQGWSHKKKKALIERNFDKLHELAECQNDSHYKNMSVNVPFDYAQGTTELQETDKRTLSGVEMSDHNTKEIKL